MAPKAKADKASGSGDGKHQSDAPGMGHNGDALSEDQKIARFFSYKKRWEAARLTLKNLEEEIKTKIGKQGVRDIRTAVALQTEEGEERLKEKIESQLRIARWLGIAIGAQGDLFPTNDPTPLADRAYAAGKLVGIGGDPAKPPHDPSTEAYREWMRGHADGNEALARSGFKSFPEGHPA